MAGQRSGRRALGSAAILLSLAAGLLAAEVIVRLLGLAPLSSLYGYYVPDPVLPFRLAPNVEFTGEAAGREYAYVFRHNSLGYRDVEHAVAKPPGTFRILGIGDSFTYGVGAAWEDTFLRRLELDLAHRRQPVEVIKAGIPRSFPEAERMLLEQEGLRFDPDLVIAAFVPNDVIDTDAGLDAVTVDDTGYLHRKDSALLGPAGTALYLHCHACRLALQAGLGLLARWTEQADWPEVYADGGRYEPAWQRVEAEYTRMAELARARGIPFVLLYIPDKPRSLDYFGITARDYPRDRLRRWAGRAGVSFVDPTGAMADASRTRELYWPQDPHCNAEGYGVIAATLREVLDERGLVPPPTTSAATTPQPGRTPTKP